MNLDERQEGLLRLVEEYREQECGRILAAARQEAAELMRQSFHKQRAHLHRQVLAERNRARAKMQAARAEQATQERRTSEVETLALLQSAWPLLRERLLVHWQVPEQRRHWAETYLRRALDLLPHGHWTVRHAPEWREPERRGSLAELTEVLARRRGSRAKAVSRRG